MLQFDEKIKGKVCVVKGDYSVQGTGDETGQGYSGNTSGSVGIYTGNIQTWDNKTFWYEIKPFGAYDENNLLITGNIAFAEDKGYSRSSAQSTLNSILRDHKYIMQNLEISSYLADKLPQTQEVKDMKDNLGYLYLRLKMREDELKNKGLVESVQTGYDTSSCSIGIDTLNSLIKQRYPYLGVVPVAVYYIVTAVVAVAVGAFIYYKLTNIKEAADYDLKLSNEFLKWLKEQSPETTKIVLNQLKATGDSAYKSALESKGTGILESLRGAGNVAKWGLIGAGLLFVYTQVDTAKLRKTLKKKFK